MTERELKELYYTTTGQVSVCSSRDYELWLRGRMSRDDEVKQLTDLATCCRLRVSITEGEMSEILELATKCGAVLTGKPDGSEAVSVVFTPLAWRAFASEIVNLEAKAIDNFITELRGVPSIGLSERQFGELELAAERRAK